MNFENNSEGNLSKKIGYIGGYFLFTTVLYLILYILHKLPENWSYLHIMGITLTIAIVGEIIKKILK